MARKQVDVKVIQPIVEFLDSSPEAISKPVKLIGERAYATTWLDSRVTVREEQNADGSINRYDPPIVRNEQQLIIIRDDGIMFGIGAEPIEDLGVEIQLKTKPRNQKLWSKAGVIAYHNGERPEARDVFERIVEVVDRFIDFDRSFADQRTMSEMMACYIMATWFLDAFTVTGFLWPNGERGSGKTQLLLLVAEIGYLGEVILAGGSYASLRDMADYGATLCFDDAENLAARNFDADKKALLLAGNRRGNTVPLKDKTPDGEWVIRYVNTFCPRVFSAIGLPDPVLASRTIVVPLVRTTDRQRANADVQDYARWPHMRRQLVDDLWALSLANLADLPAYEAEVNQSSKLLGRNLEPWRAMLAVARWLEDRGIEGLWQRMEELSMGYQDQRQEIERPDLITLVIQALCQCASGATSKEVQDAWVFTVEEVRGVVANLVKESGASFELGIITNERVGLILGPKLRLIRGSRSGGRGSRLWRVTLDDLKKWTSAYNLKLTDWMPEVKENGGDAGEGGTSGTSGTGS